MLKLLYIGNSFSMDILEHSVDIAHDLGISDIKVGDLYYASCSLKMHLNHALGDEAKYTYYVNDGAGWIQENNVSISAAIKSDDWDIIGIFPGTGDGSVHSSGESYERLPELVDYVKKLARPDVKLIYSMTWLSEKDNPRKELALYNGDQELVMSMISDRIRENVIASGQFWKVVPTGAAVQNARNAPVKISRDGYHLTLGMGRYMAALTVIGSITDKDITTVRWIPAGMSEEERAQAIRFAQKALLDPFDFRA